MRGQVGPGGDGEFLERVPEMGLDGGLGDEQVLGDLPVGQAVGGEAGHPPFGAGERVRAGEGGASGPGPGREQLPPGPLGERRGAGALREIQGAAQRATGVGPPSRPAPGQPALISGDPDPARRRQWRYGELLAEAERGARALTARFRPGDRVAVWAGNCPEWVLLEFAAGLAGVTLVTVNPAYQADELAHVLGHSGARGVFLAAEHRGSSLPAILATVRGRLPELREVIPLGEWDGFCASGDGGRLPEVDPHSPAQILYTSGTTGRPKAAVLTHRGLTNNARLAAGAMGMRAGEAGVNPMPLFHVAGGGLLTLGILQSTGTQVLMPHFDPGAGARAERDLPRRVLRRRAHHADRDARPPQPRPA